MQCFQAQLCRTHRFRPAHSQACVKDRFRTPPSASCASTTARGRTNATRRHQIFDVQVRDFSAYAVALHGKPSSTAAQQAWAMSAVRKPATDSARFDRVWEHVRGYDGAYAMRP